jgi:Pathogenicity locus
MNARLPAMRTTKRPTRRPAKRPDKRAGRTTRSPLEEIPGVGPAIAADLESLGINSVAQLKRRSPEALYKKLCDLTATRQDPCVLYTFRCAVYYAANARHDPEKLKWWNWKNID